MLAHHPCAAHRGLYSMISRFDTLCSRPGSDSRKKIEILHVRSAAWEPELDLLGEERLKAVIRENVRFYRNDPKEVSS